MVEMVTNKAFGGVGDLAVHTDVFASLFSEGIVGRTLFGGMPLVTGKGVVIFGVDDCEFALGEGDSAERVAVAEAAV